MEKIVLHIENIKSHAKQIEKASAFKVKHLQMLNQISETLGFTNYQILKGISNDNNKYFEVSIDNIKNSFVYERLLLLDSLKDQCLQASPLETLDTQNEQYFLNLKDKMLNIVIDSLKTFSFLDLNVEKILNNHMSFDSIIYYLFLAIKFKKQEIEKNILDYFDCDNILLIKTEFNTGKYPVYNFEDFLKKFTHLLDDSNLKQKHAYAHQQWHQINNRFKEYFKERLENGQSFLYIDPKSNSEIVEKYHISVLKLWSINKKGLDDIQSFIMTLLLKKISAKSMLFLGSLKKLLNKTTISSMQMKSLENYSCYLDKKIDEFEKNKFVSKNDFIEMFLKLEEQYKKFSIIEFDSKEQFPNGFIIKGRKEIENFFFEECKVISNSIKQKDFSDERFENINLLDLKISPYNEYIKIDNGN